MGCIRYLLLKCSSTNGPKAVLNTCQPKIGRAYQDKSSECNPCLWWTDTNELFSSSSVRIEISRTICLTKAFQGLYTYITCGTGFQMAFWGLPTVSVWFSREDSGKYPSNFFLFFLCMKYLKSRYWVECCPINPKIVIRYTHVANLPSMCAIHLLYIPTKSFLPWKPEQTTK